MSLIRNGPVPEVICEAPWEGEAAGGEPAVDPAAVDGSWSRERSEERIGRVSI